ncbi:iron ABC transporter permease [Halobacillus shinanisalinarum]|uniref:Iron ABC transporter permease n=1 Tax=Halobacillus shinanisalinarum TaxID=2932258 RepID=A0ABY4H5Z6_9BACI|nr:iron ABC transporter permease [Halobacillus shinanisalinarum]UOQ94372.1 iron ABC transporter permease [Halobacillus shinanisalinarum]
MNMRKLVFKCKNKITIILSILLLIIAGVFIMSAGLGDVKLTPLAVLKVLFGGGTELDQLVVVDFRLPRIILALFVGMSLAVAGGILQGMVRNPLASPDIIGITAGASTAVVAFLWIFSDGNHALMVSIQWLPVAAFIGSTLIAFLVYYLAWKDGVSPVRLVLIGIGIASLMQAATTMFMIVGPIYRATQANIWITGSLNGATWENVWVLMPWTIVLLLIAFTSARTIDIQELGEEVATAVGNNVERSRFLLLLISTALVGGAVAFAGGIGFVGLMAPHMARRLVGSSFAALLPTSACIGAILVMAADLIGRTLFSPLEVPAGVFTAAIGAPYFIFLLYKTKSS